jgi:hypothetical protein
VRGRSNFTPSLFALEPAITRLQEALAEARAMRDASNDSALEAERAIERLSRRRAEDLELLKQRDAEIRAYEMALQELTPGRTF